VAHAPDGMIGAIVRLPQDTVEAPRYNGDSAFNACAQPTLRTPFPSH
jgi:hypothetical protein